MTAVERDPSVAAEARACGVDVHEVDVRRLDEVSRSFSAVICMWASFRSFDYETNADVFASMGAKTKTHSCSISTPLRSSARTRAEETTAA